MKKKFKKLVLVAMVASLAFVGCEKNNIHPVVPGTTDGESVKNHFAGTSWVSHLENSLNSEGIMLDLAYDVQLDFVDSVNAEMLQTATISIPAFPEATQSEHDSVSFVYTFTEDSVYLHGFYVEDSDTVKVIYGLGYDKEEKTLTLDFADPDMEEIMGTTVVVFVPRDRSDAKSDIVGRGSVAERGIWQRLLSLVQSKM